MYMNHPARSTTLIEESSDEENEMSTVRAYPVYIKGQARQAKYVYQRYSEFHRQGLLPSSWTGIVKWQNKYVYGLVHL
jgi:hypothetical protein